jgi:hypothetical protein
MVFRDDPLGYHITSFKKCFWNTDKFAMVLTVSIDKNASAFHIDLDERFWQRISHNIVGSYQLKD